MRVEGLGDNEIAGLLRHAADELDEGSIRKNGKVNLAANKIPLHQLRQLGDTHRNPSRLIPDSNFAADRRPQLPLCA
jgi:hypothetical protein